MSSTRSVVSVVDDSESVRESLPDLLRHVGYDVEAFASAEEFLTSDAPSATNCLVLDVGLPGMTGPDLQQELQHRGSTIPIVFITALSDDASLRRRLMANGAAAVLFKPFTDTTLLDAVKAALRTR